MYAKVIDGAVVQYPYTEADLRAEYPNTSFPPITPDVLAQFGAVIVVMTGSPEADHTKNVRQGTPELANNRWQTTWVVEDASEEEIASRVEERAASVRADRDARLAACDWTQVDDTPIGNAKKLAWANYRQSLRDLPSQEGFPFNIVWPVKP